MVSNRSNVDPSYVIQLSKQVWIIDETPSISWNTTLGNTLIDYVFIQLVQQNYAVNLTTNYPNTGYFTYNAVNSSWVSPMQYYIKICWMKFPSVCGESLPISVAGKLSVHSCCVLTVLYIQHPASTLPSYLKLLLLGGHYPYSGRRQVNSVNDHLCRERYIIFNYICSGSTVCECFIGSAK